ncbi:MAG: c-type cytochrome [Burkholderiales bacterium]
MIGPFDRWFAAMLAATGAFTPVAARDVASAITQFEQGRVQYQRTCAQCHGHNLVNAGVTVYDLRKFPEDQRDRFVQSVLKGKGNMPSFEDALDQAQMDVLWAYVSRRGKRPE